LFSYNLFRSMRLLLPAIVLLIVGSMLLSPLPQLSVAYLDLFSQLPLLLAVICIALTISFNQGRLFLATLSLISLYLLIQSELQSSLNLPGNFVLFSLLSLLFPLLQIAISMYPEKGISLRRTLPLSLIVISGYLLFYLLAKAELLADWITILPIPMIELAIDPFLLSQGAATLYLFSLLIGALVLYFRATLADAALFSSTLGCMLILILFDKAYISSLAASLILILFLYTVLSTSYSMAFIDELTGLPGRRALENHLSSAGRKYSLAMVDIDHFKQFNDKYGHDVGDQVLRMVASQMKQAAKGATVFRYGGEEFTLVFKGRDEAAALPLAEQVREAVANYPMRIRDKDRPESEDKGRKQRNKSRSDQDTVQVCISIGLCQKTEQHQLSSDVLKQADEALYLAKQKGRNRTIAAHIAQPQSRRKTKPRRSKTTSEVS